jgi:hypothetical protein
LDTPLRYTQSNTTCTTGYDCHFAFEILHDVLLLGLSALRPKHGAKVHIFDHGSLNTQI